MQVSKRKNKYKQRKHVHVIILSFSQLDKITKTHQAYLKKVACNIEANFLIINEFNFVTYKLLSVWLVKLIL